MALVKVIRNGQITIPKELRTALGSEEGDLLEIRLTKAGMAIKPKVAFDKELAQEKPLRTISRMQTKVKAANSRELGEAIQASER